MINFVLCVGKDFLSDESETFWLNIDGHYEQKVQELKVKSKGPFILGVTVECAVTLVL